MTRLIVALAAALLLQGWGLLSSRLLPWPDVYGRMPLPATSVLSLSREMPPRTPRDDEPDEFAPLPAGSTFAPPAPAPNALVAANGNDWPIYAFGRREQALSGNAASAYLALNVALGVIAALAAALVVRERKAAPPFVTPACRNVAVCFGVAVVGDSQPRRIAATFEPHPRLGHSRPLAV